MLGPATAFIALVTSLAITSIIGICLLSAGQFRVRWLLTLHGLVSLALLFAVLRAGRQPIRLHRARQGLKGLATGLLLLGLLVTAAVLRIPPSFYVDGGQDQGVYVNMAAHYAKHHTLFIHDDLLERAYSGSKAERAALQPLLPLASHPVPGRVESWRYPGLYIGDSASGTVVPQFYHLHPMWMSLFWLMFGPAGSVYAVALFALVALMAIYFLCQELFRTRWVGVLAVALLAVNVLQVWVNRYPVSETVAQFWLFAGLFLYVEWRRTDSAGEMWLSAACLGLYAFTRFAALLMLPVYILAFWLGEERRRDYLFYNLLFAFHVWAFAHATAFSFPYLRDLFYQHGLWYAVEPWQVVIMGLAAIALLNLAKWSFQRVLWDRLGEAILRYRALLVLAVAIVAAALLVRHLVLTRAPASMRLVQFSWYITAPGLAAALIGSYLIIRHWVAARDRMLPAGLMVAVVLFQFVIQRTNGYQFYYARYYVSEALPFCAIALGFLVVRLVQSRRVWARSVGAVSVMGLLSAYLVPYTYNPAFRVRELDGQYDTMRSIAHYLPGNSVTFVAVDGSVPLTDTGALATGLMHVMDRYTLPASDPARVFAAVPLIRSLGKAVYLLQASADRQIEDRSLEVASTWIAAGKGRLVISEHELAVPEKTVSCAVPWKLYELRVRSAGEPWAVRYDSRLVSVSNLDTAEGFGWTRGHASIAGIRTPAATPLTLRVILNHLFPVEVSPRVQVVVNGATVFDRVVSGTSLHDQAEIGPIRVPSSLNRSPLTVELISDTWCPAELWPDSTDSRRLGLDLVELKFARAEP